DLTNATHRAALTVADWPIRPVPARGDIAALPLSARLSGTLETAGAWQRPTGAAAFDVRDATWEGHAVSTVSLRGRSDGTLVGLTLEAPEWRTSGRGEIRLTDGYPFDVTL